MRLPLTAVFALLFTCALCQGPITLGNSNMPSNGDTLRFTNVDLSTLGNYAVAGAGLTWDFTDVTSLAEGVRDFKAALLTPYALFFLGLNEYGEKIADSLNAGPVKMKNIYNYYKKQTNPVSAFVADGTGITFSSVPVPTYYSDKDELYVFPMTYPKKDSTTFRFATPATTMIPVRYSRTGYRITEVDGYGTVITPYGTSACLRIVTTQYAQDTIRSKFQGFDLPPVGFPVVTRSYQWLTSGAKIPYMEITGNVTAGNFTPTQARYRGYWKPVNAVGLAEESAAKTHGYPNPADDFLVVTFSPDAGEPVVYDITGKPMQLPFERLARGEYKVDTSTLPAGAYVARGTAGGASGSMVFIKR